MQERYVRLVYPPELVYTPVVSQLIRRYEITVNIIRAQISEESGWIEATLSGAAPELEAALGWLRSQGIQIIDLETS